MKKGYLNEKRNTRGSLHFGAARASHHNSIFVREILEEVEFGKLVQYAEAVVI
jgi:hypothetical protein